jgi:predicted MFS family arabinose efflux permease
MQVASKPRNVVSRANAISLVTGLSAWLGGVAFCIGFGVSAPVWVAGVVTVLSVAFARLGARAQRRSGQRRGRGASSPATD